METAAIADSDVVAAVDGEEHVLTSGESYTIPDHEAHAAVNAGDELVHGVDIFCPPCANPASQD